MISFFDRTCPSSIGCLAITAILLFHWPLAGGHMCRSCDNLFERQTVLCQEDMSCRIKLYSILEMWANAQRDGRPAEYRWRPLFNAASLADTNY